MMKYMHQYKQKKKEKDEYFGLVAKNKFLSSVPYLNLLITALTPQYALDTYTLCGPMC